MIDPHVLGQFNGGLTLDHVAFGSLSMMDMATFCLASILARTTRK